MQQGSGLFQNFTKLLVHLDWEDRGDYSKISGGMFPI